MNEDKATRYNRLSRRAGIAAVVVSGALLLVLALTPASVFLRARVERVATSPWLVVLLYVLTLALLNEALEFPLAVYRGHVLERQYELSTQRLGGWLWDHVKGIALGLIFAAGGAEVVYAFLRRWPDLWWIYGAIAFVLFGILLANLAPVLLLPIFYTFKPLARDDLQRRLEALASRARTRVVGVYEWHLSQKSRKANAALCGLGRTRRIILADTLLADYTDDEIEVVLAHELAHHTHRDIWKLVGFQAALTFAGFYLADRLLRAAAPAAGVRGLDDVAGLPLLLITAAAVSLVALPLANAFSRLNERRADEYALRATNNPAAFISAMRRLSTQNLAEPTPSRLVEILFYSHPPVAKRIAFAEQWARRAA